MAIDLPPFRTRFEGDSRSFDRAAKRAAESTRRLYRRQNALRRELRRSTAAARSYARSVLSLRSAFVTLIGGAGIGAFVRNTARAGAELQNFSDQIGISVETLQSLQRAGGDWNIEAEQITQAMTRFTRVIGEADQGLATYQRIFDQLGVNIRDSSGELRSTEAVFEDFAVALQGVGSETERNALLMQAFGRQGARLGLLFDRVGREGLQGFNASLRDAGVLTQEQVNRLQLLNREFNNLGDVYTFESRAFTAGLADEWRDLIAIVREGLPQAFQQINTIVRTTLLPLLREIATNLDGIARAIASLAVAGKVLTYVLGAFATLRLSKRSTITAISAAAVAAGRNFAAIIPSIKTYNRLLAINAKRWLGTTSSFAKFKRLLSAGLRPALFGVGKLLAAMLLSFKGIGVATLALLAPLAKFIAIALGISVIIGLIFDFETTWRNLKTFLLESFRTIIEGVGLLVQAFELIPRAIKSIFTGEDVFAGLKAQWDKFMSQVSRNVEVTVDLFFGRDGKEQAKTPTRNFGPTIPQMAAQIRAQRAFERAALRAQNRETESFYRRMQSDALGKSLDAAIEIPTGDAEAARFARAYRNQNFARTFPSYTENIEKAEEASRRLQEQLGYNQQMLDGMQSSFGNFFESLIDGTAKAADAFKALAREIARAVLQALVIQPIAASITGSVQSFFNIPVPQNQQTGGIAHGGRPYLVGETGAELFVPATSGRIVPHGNMGGVTVQQSFNIQSTDGPGVRRALAEVAPIFRQDALSAVQEAQSRPGGLANG